MTGCHERRTGADDFVSEQRNEAIFAENIKPAGFMGWITFPHRAAVKSNPQAMSNIPTESTASNSSIPTSPFLRVAFPASQYPHKG
jgi:hypothetical protein